MEIFTVSFFGHRKVSQVSLVEEQLEAVIQRLLAEKEYVEYGSGYHIRPCWHCCKSAG